MSLQIVFVDRVPACREQLVQTAGALLRGVFGCKPGGSPSSTMRTWYSGNNIPESKWLT